MFAKRFICYSVELFFFKIERVLQLLKVNRFSLRIANTAKIYERVLSTNMPQGKERNSFHPRSKNLSSEDSTWMVDHLKIPRFLDAFFIT